MRNPMVYLKKCPNYGAKCNFGQKIEIWESSRNDSCLIKLILSNLAKKGPRGEVKIN